jgi:methionyl-tRNA formyltransferase
MRSAASLRVIFAGTPEFARVALQHIHAAGHQVVLVLTQPDRPAGRGMKLQPSAVKQFAVAQDMALVQPRSLRLDGKFAEDAEAARQAIEAAQADVMVVVAYGLILPQWVLDALRTGAGRRLGCINIHGSLLPRWRGAAPIHRAIEAGDTHTGVTLMQMDAGLDTGDMLQMQSIPILPDDTTGTLHDRLADLGADMVLQVLDAAQSGALQPVAQPSAGICYAHKIEKHEAAIDWNQSAATIVRRIRAFDPFPGAATVWGSETVKVWSAQCVGSDGVPSFEASKLGAAAPGTVLHAGAEGVMVATADVPVLLTMLQRPGGKRMVAAEFLRGFAVQPGWQLR